MLPGRWHWSFLALLVLVVPSTALVSHALHAYSITATCKTTVHYSPHGGAASAVVHALNQAEKTSRVAIYGLNQPQIVSALIAAKVRVAEVTLKADKVQSAGKTQKAAITQLRGAGITVEVSTQSRLLHDKFAVIDGRWVITGSFNWTDPAENRNRENLLIFDCPNLAMSYSSV